MKHSLSSVAPDIATRLPVDVNYLTLNELEKFLCHGGPLMLGEIHFGTALRDISGAGHPHALVSMAQLNPIPLVEVWSSRVPVSHGSAGDVVYAHTDEILFGCLNYSPAAAHDIEAAVRRAYDAILSVTKKEGFPHLLRIWNYFSDITEETGGFDRYQCFCRGRFEALERHFGEFDRKLPAASAVGTQGGGLILYFIAARTPGRHRENPRQISAYHYPPQYGPKSPSFARAMLKRWGNDYSLYISGTASIVGHQSLHAGEVHLQVQETLNNLSALIEATAAEEGVGLQGLASLNRLKVYIRHPEHLEAIQAALDAVIASHVPRLYLQADICRDDLLLEIEGIAHAAI